MPVLPKLREHMGLRQFEAADLGGLIFNPQARRLLPQRHLSWPAFFTALAVRAADLGGSCIANGSV